MNIFVKIGKCFGGLKWHKFCENSSAMVENTLHISHSRMIGWCSKLLNTLFSCLSTSLNYFKSFRTSLDDKFQLVRILRCFPNFFFIFNCWFFIFVFHDVLLQCSFSKASIRCFKLSWSFKCNLRSSEPILSSFVLYF